MRPQGANAYLLMVAVAASFAWSQAGHAAVRPQDPAMSADAQAQIQHAKTLMVSGKREQAKATLLSLEHVRPNDSEVIFLLGLIAMDAHDYRGAVHLFRSILAREPKALRVRLELARAFFFAHDDENSERQFLLARAARLPAADVANIDSYLRIIEQRRRWRYSVTASAAPDTDANVAPTISAVDIYGLPFQLSPEARRQSGVGFQLDASAERLAPVNDSVALRFGAQLHSLDYGVSQFDDTTLSLIAGPRFQVGHWQLTPSATGFYRWYGARFYNDGAGGSVEADVQAALTLWLTSVLSAQALTYAPPAGQGGPFVSASFGVTHTLSPISTVTAAVTLGRLDAYTTAYAYDTLQVNAGYARELSQGFTVTLQAGYAILNFDAALPAFGVAREDRQFTTSVSLLNRGLDFRGFTPRIAYSFTHNASNIPLFAYDRSRIELGATRAF